jgi:hypothetical protein
MSIQYSERKREIEESNRRMAEMEYYESMARCARAHAAILEREIDRRETSSTGTWILLGVALVVCVVAIKYVAGEAHLSF